jgi:hypothetical protein
MKYMRVCFLAALALAIGLLSDVHAANLITTTDPIVPIWQTVIGGNSTTSVVATSPNAAGQYPATEFVANAFDGLTTTKYLNFGTGGGSSVNTATKGVGTGFYATPALGPSIVTGVRVATANDSPLRDPLSVSIEGSNASGAALDLGSSWSLIFNGNLGIDVDPGRFITGPLINVPNLTPYKSYRVLVQSQRGVANSAQYSEMTLIGNFVPEPSSVVLGAFGIVTLVGVGLRRRKR